ncbi:MAG: GGDEF domain-containing response regulator [Acidiferrobacteraceae bacterium]
MISRPQILIADDSRVIRKVIAQILKIDFDLIEKEDGESAWEALQDDTIDVVITDVEMPRLDGCELLTRLRASERPILRDMPVIVITGADDEVTKNRAFECGATDFIIKPIDRVQLLARVRGQVKLERDNRRLAVIAASTIEDPETGISNKRGLMQRGAADLAYARRHGTTLAAVRFNVSVRNGDLAKISLLFRTRIRQEDTLAHLGNGAFALLSPCTDADEAMLLSARLQRELAALQSPQAHLTRYGMVSLGEADKDISDLLLGAELAATPRDVTTITESTPSPPVPDLPLETPDTERSPGDGLLEGIVLEPASESAVTDRTTDTAHADEGPAQGPVPSLDAALDMLRQGRFDALRPHLHALALQSLPLIELCNSAYSLGLTVVIRSLRDRLSRRSDSDA